MVKKTMQPIATKREDLFVTTTTESKDVYGETGKELFNIDFKSTFT